MDDAVYIETQAQLVTLCLLVASLPDLDRFLARIGTAEAVGPLLDPTLYRKAAPKLGQVREIANAARGAPAGGPSPSRR